MRRIDLVNVSIYMIGLMLLFGIGLLVYNIYEQNRPITAQVEDIETIISEEVCRVSEPEKIDETVFESENTVVSYTAPPVEEIVEPEIPEPTYFDVPLDDALQDHIFEVCESYGVDPAIVIAMIQKESTYRVDCMGDNGNAYGLMQVQPRWHQARMDRLGVTDLLDPYQNVLVGIDYFAELLGYEQGLNWSLMAYNGGINYANKKTAAGEVSGYVKVVTATADELRMQLTAK